MEQLKEEVVVAGGKQQKFNHTTMSSGRVYVSIYRASECDKIVQIAEEQHRQQYVDDNEQQQQQVKLYLHNGSICGIVKDNFVRSHTDVEQQNVQVK